MMIATLSNVQWMVELEDETKYIISAVVYIIPAIVITALNAAIFRQLKRLLTTDTYSSATDEIKKVLFQIRMTNLIAIIFVASQVGYFISVSLMIVSWFFMCFIKVYLKIVVFFSILSSVVKILK